MTGARVLIVAAVLVGVLIGIGGYTFVYAKGYSYLTNDPAACANHRALAVSVEGGYKWPKTLWSAWVRGGVAWHSGDGDGADDTHGTFFPMVPTVRRFSQSTLYSLANLRDGFAQVMLRPRANVSARVDLHLLSLSRSADGWYVGSGATQESGRIFGYTLRRSGGESRLTEVLEGSIDWP